MSSSALFARRILPSLPNDMQTHRAVFEEVLEVVLATLKLFRRPPKLAYVLEAVYGTHLRAVFIEEGFDVRKDRHAGAIGPLDDDTEVAHRRSGLKNLRHRGGDMVERLT